MTLFLVFALPLNPVVLVLQLPQSGTHSHLTFAILPLSILSVAFLKLTASSRPSAPPSGSPKCLRFGHWLISCTINIHLLTYLLTYILTYLLNRNVVKSVAKCQGNVREFQNAGESGHPVKTFSVRYSALETLSALALCAFVVELH